MDFEEQLHRTEGLPAPSLTGASVRSADDSPHNNYIHPEKYASLRDPVRPDKSDYKSKLSSSVTASLDDLINEGALMGSEEDFDRYLDSEGHVKDNAIFEDDKKQESTSSSDAIDKSATSALKTIVNDKKLPLSQEIPTDSREAEREDMKDSAVKLPSASQTAMETCSSRASDSGEPVSTLYSTPNLSEYQLSHNLSSQLDLVDSLQSHDYHELPTSDSHSSAAVSSTGQGPLRGIRNTNALFDRSPSRPLSFSAVPGRRPAHLARGDNYKSTHPEDPQNYELPARLDNAKLSPSTIEADALRDDADEDRGRQSRKSKTTMGDKVARAEAGHIPEPITQLPMSREPSLLTSGDYCNFNADTPSHDFKADERIYSTRSASSTNYLRSISRSRSRVRHVDTEKNDANCKELTEDGALVSEDPFETIANLDVMVDQVLHPTKEKRSHSSLAKEIIADEAASSTLGAIGKSNGGADQNSALLEQASVSEAIEHAATTPKVVHKTTGTTTNKLNSELEVGKDAFDISVAKKEPKILEESAVAESPSMTEVVDTTQEHKAAESGETHKNVTSSESQAGPISSDEHVNAELSQVVKDLEALTHSHVNEPELIDSQVAETLDTSKPESQEANEGAPPKIIEGNAISHLSDVNATKASQAPLESENGISADSEDLKISDASETIAKPAAIDQPETKKSLEIKTEEAEPKAPVENADTTKAKSMKTEDFDEEYDVSPEELRKHLMAEPVYIYTSLAGGMHIMQKTNRLTTILTANEVKFTYRDLGTDPEAKRIWQRQANGRPLPGVVRGDDLIGNYAEIDEANEEGRVDTLLYETM